MSALTSLKMSSKSQQTFDENTGGGVGVRDRSE